MIKIIIVAVIFAILLVVLVSFPKTYNKLKIILSVIAIFVSLYIFAVDHRFEILQQRSTDILLSMNKEFLEKGKPVVTVKDQESILSKNYLSPEQSYLREYVRVSFIDKSMVTIIRNRTGDSKCRFFIHDMNKNFGDKYKILVNNKNIKEMTHSEEETKNFCAANKKIVVQAFLPE